MKLSTKSRYGLKAAYTLAKRYGEGPLSLREIAQAEGLTEKYLEQLLALLKKAGLLETARGAGGGYQLSRPPAQIEVLRVVEALEPIVPVDCLSHNASCDASFSCATRRIWERMANGIRESLAGLTLADMLHPVNPGSLSPVKCEAKKTKAKAGKKET